jgi:signal transduction histidine kinase
MQRGQIILQEEITDLATIVITQGEKYQALAANDHVTLLLQIEDDLKPAMLDKPLVERMVETLVANAIKYAPAESCIKVVLSMAIGETESGAALADQPIFRLHVADQGPEVPSDIFDNILQQLDKSNHTYLSRPTTELGLAFCKMVVAAHGGAIRVSAEQPKGARFTVDLPCKR